MSAVYLIFGYRWFLRNNFVLWWLQWLSSRIQTIVK